MNIVVYPDVDKELNPNERMFSKLPINDFPNLKFIDQSQITTLEKSMLNFKDINSITILLDNYGTFIATNIDYILSHTHIKFFIHENDIHYLKSKNKSFSRYMLLRDKLKTNPHINILAYYWYDYQRRYNINENNLVCFPKFIREIKYSEINSKPIPKVVLSGSCTSSYPMRKYLRSIEHPNLVKISHTDNIYGEEYYQFLHNHLAAFTCCLNKDTPYIINKFFEIPSLGCLLLAYDEHVRKFLDELGFIDNENYISCTKNNVIQKIEWICDPDNIDKVNKIRLAGYQLIKSRHTLKHRLMYLNQLVSK